MSETPEGTDTAKPINACSICQPSTGGTCMVCGRGGLVTYVLSPALPRYLVRFEWTVLEAEI